MPTSNLLQALRANLADQSVGQYLDELQRVLNADQVLRDQEAATTLAALEAKLREARTAIAVLSQELSDLTRDDRYQLTKAKVVRLLKANNLYEGDA